MKRSLLFIILTVVLPLWAHAKIEATQIIPGGSERMFYRFADEPGKDTVHYSKDNGVTWKLLAQGTINKVFNYTDSKWGDLPARVEVGARTIALAQATEVRVVLNGNMTLLLKSADAPEGEGRYILPEASPESVVNSAGLSHGNETYRIYSYVASEGPKTVLIRRSDGKSVVMSRTLLAAPVSATIENGIIRVAGIPRQVDLLALDVEATFIPQGEGQIVGPDNSKSSAVELVNSLFDDLMDQGGKPLPISESDQKTIDAISANLRRPQRSSTVLLGGPGTGKTTIVKEALRGLPRTWKVRVLDATALNSGARNTGVIEQRVDAIIKASEVTPIIWFADEIHSLRGIGTHSQNSNDIFEYLKKPLADGRIKMIATDTPTEYYEKINDPAIQRRLTVVELKPPTPIELRAKIQTWLKFQNLPALSEDVLTYLIETAADFNASENEPSRSVGLIEASAALLQPGENMTNKTIDQAAATIYKVDPSIRDVFAMREKIRALPAKLDNVIVGQDMVKEPLIMQTKIALANLHDGVGPRVSEFITGVPGVGKTELAKAYAQSMDLPFRVIEMARYGGGDRTGNDLMTEISEQIRTNAFSVIIFDEIEKAHPKVLEALLTYMSNDQFTAYEKTGTTTRTVQVSSKNSSAIMTSNAGTTAIQDYFAKLDDVQRDRPRREFGDVFNQDWIKTTASNAGIPQPLIDRVKAHTVALPPSSIELRQILASHMKRNTDMIQNKMKIKIDYLEIDAFLDQMVQKAQTNKMSTRDMLVSLKNYLGSSSSEILFQEDYGVKKAFALDLVTGEVKPSQRMSCEEVFH